MSYSPHAQVGDRLTGLSIRSGAIRMISLASCFIEDGSAWDNIA
jgi:hypothetical protein